MKKFRRIYTTRVEVRVDRQRQRHPLMPFERAVVGTVLKEAGRCALWVRHTQTRINTEQLPLPTEPSWWARSTPAALGLAPNSWHALAEGILKRCWGGRKGGTQRPTPRDASVRDTGP